MRADISSNFYLYDSLRLFFDNGGGDCYVVSVGADNYQTAPDHTKLKAGVEALKKYDEPTILLFPDAASLSADNMAVVQQAALAQCGALGDRSRHRSSAGHGETADPAMRGCRWKR